MPAVHSLSELIQFVAEVREEGGLRDELVFRGQGDVRWNLVSKLHREGVYDQLSEKYGTRTVRELERYLTTRLVRSGSQYATAATYPVPASNFMAWLCLAQHHGLPTCLLDWTLNAGVAAYFACSEAADVDGAVWVMRLKRREDRERMTLRLETTSIGDGGSKTFEQVEIDKARLQGLLNVENPLYVIPTVLTRRIEAQSGRFTYCHLPEGLDTRTGMETPWESLRKVVIPSEKKPMILKELANAFRISRASVYADIDALAQELGS